MVPRLPASPRLWRAVFALAVAAQLVALYWPRPVEPGTSLPVDKLVHAAVFGGVLWAGVLARVPVRPLALLLLVHAPVSEVVQARLIDRDGNVPDALADVTGVLLVWLWAELRARRARGDGDRGRTVPADARPPHRR